MNLLDRINNAAADTDTLHRFLEKNASEITDWLNKLPHNDLVALHDSFREFLLLRIDVWRALPKSEGNLAFLSLLLEKAEQLGDQGSFHRLIQELVKVPFDLGSRLNAAALYLSNGPDYAEGFVALFDPIYSLCAEAVENEDDDPDKALSTMIHYYVMAIEAFGEYNSAVPNEIRRRFRTTITVDPSSFLACPLINDVLTVSHIDPERAAAEIRGLLDGYLNREQPVLSVETGLLIEGGTSYCALLEAVDSEFNAIRDISVIKHQSNLHSEQAYNSLNRGTKIIDREDQLYAYMTAFGPMHSGKLLSAYEEVDFENMVEPITVIDWGCGQGTATMVLFDYIERHHIPLDVQKVILVEPSELALKRGSRHSLKFDDSIALETINKPLDDLVAEDFTVAEGTVIHLFSNILDVRDVSLAPLIDLIKTTFTGDNFFICVSPYVDGTVTQRLNLFMAGFQDRDLHEFFRADNRKGQWIGKWTRVVRVFSAIL